MQTLFVFKLLFTGEEPKKSEAKELNAKQRDALRNSGLISYERRGRADHIVLTDKAWAWVAENLDAEISISKSASPALRGLLGHLKQFLKASELSFAEIFRPREELKPLGDTVSRIRDAYFQLSGGQRNVRVRLKDLRKVLSDMTRAEIDTTLLRLQNDRRLVLMHLDDPGERNLEDEQASINILGYKRHIIYMEG
jgi:hypothetical protein